MQHSKVFLLRFSLLFLFIFTLDHLQPFSEPMKKSSSSKVKFNMNRRQANHSVRSSTKRKAWKNIIIMNSHWGSRTMWQKIFRRQIDDDCGDSGCYVNIDERDIGSADAVLFYGGSLFKLGLGPNINPFAELNSYRRQEQVFVFFSDEAPPALNYIHLKNFNYFFNWTMTYRSDSDIVVPYGRTTKRAQKRPMEEIQYVSQEELSKKKMAVWMASHCETQSKREELVKQLQRYITVDVYGLCGENKCGITSFYANSISGDPCVQEMKKYSFYFAFENSLCPDYVTEKFYRTLKLGIIPVVFGAVNYTKFGPPGSFIDSKAFANVADLANHLKKVSSDAQLYNKYLRWQEDYDVESGFHTRPFICDLCKKLHEQSSSRARKSYPDIRKWFDDKQCMEFEDFITI